MAKKPLEKKENIIISNVVSRKYTSKEMSHIAVELNKRSPEKMPEVVLCIEDNEYSLSLDEAKIVEFMLRQAIWDAQSK